MRLRRRTFLQLVAGAAVLPAVSRMAEAQAYPSRPITLVVPFGPGSATDTVARIIALPLGIALNQNIVVEAKPGANGTIAASMVARAAADGYTLILSTNTPHSAAPSLMKSISYAKANPGTLSFASDHASSIVAEETLKRWARLDIVHIPYRSTPPALNEV